MKRLFLAFVALMAVSFSASAQTTTASLKGYVTDSNGKPLAGATVVATHTPTETVYGTTTDINGAYRLQGLRVGAPYTVEFSFVGYKDKKIGDIALALGETRQIDSSLDDTQAIDAVVVTGNRFVENRMGTGEVFHSDLIERTPTVSRSIDDITRLAPQAMISKDGGISIAGTNSRYNSFQIDGTASNDMYGLTSTGTNGGLAGANPIPLDAISDIQVVTAPFDVRQGGFSGGGINAITKSGTNTFSGRAYAYYNNQDFYGRSPINGVKLATQQTQIYGVSLGGAIVKNRLFFFLNGEFNLDSSPSSYFVGDSGCNISEADAKAIAERFYALTGYDGGGYGKQTLNKRTGSLIARLDWNINSRNNLSLRYNFLDARKDEFVSSATVLRFNGEGYTSIADTHSVVAELNSRVSDKMFNEFRVGYTRVHDGRDAMSGEKYPYVEIQKMRDGENTSVYIGTDPFAIMNDLVQNTVTLTDNFSYYTDAHTITIGTHNEIFNSSCLYMANALGAYTYKTLDDFLADNARKYVRNYPIGNPATNITSAQFGIYIQDEWNASPRFSMTYGLRADIPVVFGNPPTNEAFNSSDIAKKYNIQTNQVPRPTVLLSPRIGLRWRIAESADAKTLLRGGAGIFSGRIPFVWISNCFSNTGMTQRGYTLDSGKGQSVPKFGEEPTGTVGVSSNPMLNIVAKDFRYPQIMRATLALEQEYKGWHFMIECIFTKSINDLLITNLTAQDKGAKFYAVNSALATAENTTTLYNTSLAKEYSSIYLLSNTSKGFGYSVSASVSKHFRFGLDLYAAYTFSHSYSVMDGISAQALNTWSRNYSADSNNQPLSYSLFDVPHKVTASLSYSKRYGKVFGTTVSLLYQGYSGMRYSLTYASTADANNDGSYGNTTIYVPTASELQAMEFESEEHRNAFAGYIEATPALRRSRGKFLDRNALQTPFEHHLDLHIAQDFYFGAHTSRKVQISLDVINLGSLISKDWGASYYTSKYKISPVEIYDYSTDSEGNRTPKYRFVGGSVSRNDLLSRWRMQVGVRVVF
ncbi:MAG: TonB-dependent receptor [Alistipes sp.]|nr:TonB-dependent receptor [Alistipes sp.]